MGHSGQLQMVDAMIGTGRGIKPTMAAHQR